MMGLSINIHVTHESGGRGESPDGDVGAPGSLAGGCTAHARAHQRVGPPRRHRWGLGMLLLAWPHGPHLSERFEMNGLDE